MLAHTPHTLTLTPKQDKTKTKHQNKPSSKNKKSVTYLHYWKENMLSFSCFLNVLTLRDNLISLGKEFQKLGPDVFTPLDAKFVLFSSNYNWPYFLYLDCEFVIVY